MKQENITPKVIELARQIAELRKEKNRREDEGMVMIKTDSEGNTVIYPVEEK